MVVGPVVDWHCLFPLCSVYLKQFCSPITCNGCYSSAITKKQFEKKTVEELSAYLKDNGMDGSVCITFEGS